MRELCLLFGAALVAGAVDALAGGGSVITLPALIFYDLPPTAANATAVPPGYATALWRLRADIEASACIPLTAMIVIAAAGGVTGALLLAIGNKTFSAIVPWLMLVATVIFAIGHGLKKPRPGSRSAAGSPCRRSMTPVPMAANSTVESGSESGSS